MSSVQRSVARTFNSKLLKTNLHPFSSMSAQSFSKYSKSYNGNHNNNSITSKRRWQERVREMEGLSLRRIDANTARKLFEQEKYRLPKDIDFVSNSVKKDEITLKINKLNQESSITLRLQDRHNQDWNETQTEIIEINRKFAIAHEPIAVAVQGTLNKYVETLQHRINKEY